jgi:cbb3-type cytochrome oxidase cytochrome c subunit
VGDYRPPVLVGPPDKPGTIIVGAIGMFLVVLMLGLIGPSVAVEEPGARTSEIPFSQAAVDGQHVYGSLGCAACHTQMVRPVVADVGLGAVTLNDTNQVVGDRRFGPDLADVGTRMTSSQLESTITGETTGHPSHNLAEDDMGALVAYLLESRTSGG